MCGWGCGKCGGGVGEDVVCVGGVWHVWVRVWVHMGHSRQI